MRLPRVMCRLSSFTIYHLLYLAFVKIELCVEYTTMNSLRARGAKQSSISSETSIRGMDALWL